MEVLIKSQSSKENWKHFKNACRRMLLFQLHIKLVLYQMFHSQHLAFPHPLPTNLMLKNTFCFSNSHLEILIPLKGSSVAVHTHFARNKTAVIIFNILYTKLSYYRQHIFISSGSPSNCFCYYFFIYFIYFLLDLSICYQNYCISSILRCIFFSLHVNMSEIHKGFTINMTLYLTISILS